MAGLTRVLCGLFFVTATRIYTSDCQIITNTDLVVPSSSKISTAFNVELIFDVDLTSEAEDNYETVAIIVLPGSDYTVITDCRELIDNSTDDCTAYTNYDTDIQIDSDSVDVSPFSDIYDQTDSMEGLNYTVSISSTGLTTLSVNITLSVQILEDPEDYQQEFQVYINVYNSTGNLIADDDSQSETVTVVGAFLQVTSSISTTGGEVGVAEVGDSVVTQQFSITMSGDSTQDGNNFAMDLTVYDTAASSVTLVEITIGGAGPTNITQAYPSGIDVDIIASSAFTLTDSTTIVLTITRGSVSNDLELGVGLTCGLNIYYTDEDDMAMDKYAWNTVPTDGVDFTDPGAVDIPGTLYAGDTFSVTRSFTMPYGTLTDAAFIADFDLSVPTDSFPVTIVSATLTDDDSVLAISGDASQTTSNNDWTEDVSRRRKKRNVSAKILKKSEIEALQEMSHIKRNVRKSRSIVGSENSVAHLSRSRRSVDTYSLVVDFGDIVNPSSGGSDPASLTIDVQFRVRSNANGGGDLNAGVGFSYNGIDVFFTSGGSVLISPSLDFIDCFVEMENDNKVPNHVNFTVVVEHSGFSNADADVVKIKVGKKNWSVKIHDDSFMGPDVSDVSFSQSSTVMSWNVGTLTQGDSVSWSYVSFPADDGEHVQSGNTYFTCEVSWYNGNSRISTTDETCIKRKDIEETSVVYQHGLTVLGFFMGLLVGAIIAFIVVLIIFCLRRNGMCGGNKDKSKSRRDTSTVAGKQGRGLITDARQAMTKGFNSIKNTGASLGASIVALLAFKDKNKQNREIDNMDIQATIDVDMDIEAERNDAMVKATNMLVTSLTKNGDIPKNVEDRCRSKFLKRLSTMEKEQENEYQKEAADIYKRLSAKNRNKLGELLESQADEREDLEHRLGNMSAAEKEAMLALQNKEHEAERDELQFMLKLEQDEEGEKLRKEYSVRRRMGIKSAQQEFLDDVIQDAKLPSGEQVDWIMKEHFKNQGAIEKMYDDEISRQRVVLEEKLARRKALAAMSEAQEDADSEHLNTVAAHHLDLIKKAKKDGVLSATEAKQLVQEAQREMKEKKEQMDKDKERQENALHERLSQRKQKQMAELKKRQQQELSAMDKNLSSGNLNPVEAMKNRQELISEQRSELAEVENDMDKEHAQELAGLRKQLSQQTVETLDTDKLLTVERLKKEGMDDQAIHKILKKHDKEIHELERVQADEREHQNANFEKRLAKQRAEWRMRKEQELNEQENLREHEEKVVQKLVDNQVAMSEDDRHKIMQEHEKQMVKLENSLTLNKLSQKRMLEERIARKRQAQMKKLEKKQAAETKKSKRGAADSDDEEADELDLMRKHTEQRIALMQGEKLSAEEELDSIRDEMTKERANALKDQEVKLAVMLAQLQMAKAKEMARIEEQQKAIFNLKSNLMDDLNDKGVLSDPECQKVIEIHQKEQEKLNKKLDSQRNKQEAALRKRLEERLRAKEEQMSLMQQSEMRELGTSMVAKIKRAALMEKHKLEIEKFRNRMEKEINQTMEELRRQNDMRRMQSLQEQEMQFINGMVRLGKFEQEELDNVVTMLFPAKSEQERKAIMDKLCEGYKAPTPEPVRPGTNQSERPGMTRTISTLEQRVKSASLSRVSVSMQGNQLSSVTGRRMRALPESPLVNRRVQSLRPESAGSRRSSNLGVIADDNDDFRMDHSFNGSIASHGSLSGKTKTGKKSRLSPDYDPDFDASYGSKHQYANDYDVRDFGISGMEYGRTSDYEENIGYGRIPATKLPPLQGPTGKKKKKKKQIHAQDDDGLYLDPEDAF